MSDAELKELLEDALEAIRHGTVTTGHEFDLSFTNRAITTMEALKDEIRKLEAKMKAAQGSYPKAA